LFSSFLSDFSELPGNQPMCALVADEKAEAATDFTNCTNLDEGIGSENERE